MRLRIKIVVHMLFEALEKMLRKFGLALVRVRENRIENGSFAKGRSMIYKTGLDPVMTKIELDRARILSFSLKSDIHSHVNVLALREALKSKDSGQRYNIIKNVLVDYSLLNKQHRNILSETIGLQSITIDEPENTPPWFVIYPWADNVDVSKKIYLSNRSTLIENVKRGGPNLNADEGGSQHYLINKERAVFEAKLLNNLLLSIEEKGYQPSAGNFDPVGAVLLIKSEEEWCWMVSGGIHRCCVLSALNYNEIDVSIKNVIYRDDVEDWPNVQNGYFDKESALKVFDNVLDGHVSTHYRSWVKKYHGISQV